MAGFKFRKFKKSLVLLFVLTFFIACEQEEANTAFKESEKTFTWRMVTTWPKNYPGVGLGAENLSKLVNKMSAGRLQIKVYGSGELVPALEVFDAVSRGTVEIGHGASYYWIGKALRHNSLLLCPLA